MTYTATAVNVMIASPGDVAAERRMIKEVIDEWNAINAQHRKLVLMPMGWETHASPEMGERPQGIINKQILKDCDLLVAVFWTRVGSPTGKAQSGTIEEIEEHLKAGRPAMLYFSAAPVRPDSVDNEQYSTLKKFKEDFRKRGLVEEFESISEFREKVARHLAQTINRKFPDSQASATQNVVIERARPSISVGLSDAAQELLIEAAKDPNGVILNYDVIGGTIIEANGRSFTPTSENRIIARWKGAIDELQRQGLIEDRSGKREYFAITDKGYRVADQLS